MIIINVSGLIGKIVIIVNVIGDVIGSMKLNEYVMFGVYIDSWDVGIGVVDDGIGMGIIMVVGYYIVELFECLVCILCVIFFVVEEIGLVGVEDYVKCYVDDMLQYVMGVEWDFGNGEIYKMEFGVGLMVLNVICDFVEYIVLMGVVLVFINMVKGQFDMSLLGKVG